MRAARTRDGRECNHGRPGRLLGHSWSAAGPLIGTHDRCTTADLLQFRIHSSRSTTILLHVPSTPIIEHCSALAFGPYPSFLQQPVSSTLGYACPDLGAHPSRTIPASTTMCRTLIGSGKANLQIGPCLTLPVTRSQSETQRRSAAWQMGTVIILSGSCSVYCSRNRTFYN